MTPGRGPMAKWNLDKIKNVNQKGTTMAKYTRSEILDTAKEYVTKDRATEHGDMESNLTTIGELWGVYLERHVDPADVAVMMTLLKIARIKSNPSNSDSWIDGCGYMSCGGELSAKRPDPKPIPPYEGGNT